MDKRTAKRRAHKIVSLLITQAQEVAIDGWSDDPREHELIKAALGEIAMSHYLIGKDEELP